MRVPDAAGFLACRCGAHFARHLERCPKCKALAKAEPVKRAPNPKGEPEGPSKLELMFAGQIAADRLPPPQTEFAFHPERNFRFDFAWPEWKLAVEVEGMVHRIKTRFESDIEKYALAQLAGWTVLRVSGKVIRDGRAIGWLRQHMENCQWIPCGPAN